MKECTEPLEGCNCINCRLKRMESHLSKIEKMLDGMVERHRGYLGLDGVRKKAK